MFMRIVVAALALVLLAAPQVRAEEDVEGKDHPLFSRMPNYFISSYESNFDAVAAPVTKTGSETVEGQKTAITYNISDGVDRASEIQILRNYENALKKLGGKAVFLDVYESGDSEYEGFKVMTGKAVVKGKEVWLVVFPFNDGATYNLVVVEREAMTQEVTTGDLGDKLATEGRVTLYINFDTAKWDLKPDARPVVQQIAEAMKKHPDMKLRVEGHTDNQGTPESNKTLSEKRAQAVREAVAAQGVDPARLSSVGLGQAEPIADNTTEEGRARNRRVELIRR